MSDALRAEFERIYGKNKQTKEGEGLDMHRLPHGGYRSMVTHYAWDAFQRGRAQPAPGEWIPVCERLPEIGIPVLVYTPRTEYLQHAIDEWVIYREAPVPFSSATIETGEGWGDHDYEDVTHWQPLPEPPKGETQ